MNSTSDASSSLQTAESWDPILASLETIILAKTTFPARTTDLVAALRARKMVDKGIKAFTIRECRGVKQGLVGRLQDSVEHVMWDEWIGDNDDDDEE